MATGAMTESLLTNICCCYRSEQRARSLFKKRSMRHLGTCTCKFSSIVMLFCVIFKICRFIVFSTFLSLIFDIIAQPIGTIFVIIDSNIDSHQYNIVKIKPETVPYTFYAAES